MRNTPLYFQMEKKSLSQGRDIEHLLILLKKRTKPRFSFYIDIGFSTFVATCPQKFHLLTNSLI